MSRRTCLALAAAGALALASGCASGGRPQCGPGEQAMLSEALYFGTSKPGGTVAPADWQAFLDEVVTPRFPQGFSVWRAAGQWKSEAGPIVSEASYVLNIVHAGASSDRQALGDIVEAYKTRFQQEAVLRVQGAVCASF